MSEQKPTAKLKVAVCYSGGASGAKHCIQQDPDYGVTYEFVGAFSNVDDPEEATGIAYFEAQGIPHFELDYKKWCVEHRVTKPFAEENMHMREWYFEDVEAKMAEMFGRYDLIFCFGLMMMIPLGFVARHAKRMLNVHPSGCDEDGKILFKGAYAVPDAFAAGEIETASVVHIMTEIVDDGPVVVCSEWLPVLPGVPAEAHQENMKWQCDGPAIVTTFWLISQLGLQWLDTVAKPYFIPSDESQSA